MFKSSQALALYPHHLIENFGSFQVALTAHATGGAKLAGEATADLRANADGIAIIVGYGNQYALDTMAIVGGPARFDRTVQATLHLVFL